MILLLRVPFLIHAANFKCETNFFPINSEMQENIQIYEYGESIVL